MARRGLLGPGRERDPPTWGRATTVRLVDMLRHLLVAWVVLYFKTINTVS